MGLAGAVSGASVGAGADVDVGVGAGEGAGAGDGGGTGTCAGYDVHVHAPRTIKIITKVASVVTALHINSTSIQRLIGIICSMRDKVKRKSSFY